MWENVLLYDSSLFSSVFLNLVLLLLYCLYFVLCALLPRTFFLLFPLNLERRTTSAFLVLDLDD